MKGRVKTETIIAEEDRYNVLLAQVLYQTITDYVGAKKKLSKKKLAYYDRRGELEQRLAECERFFKNPPYDYGDIDLRHVKRLCDEQVEKGGRLYFDRMRA